jgi:EpsI family protein
MTLGLGGQRRPALHAPFSAVVPDTLAGYTGRDVTLGEAERQVAGVTSYLLRQFTPAKSDTAQAPWFSVYVGYYDQQLQGRTIHSPKNCLPGSGWEPLTSAPTTIMTLRGPVTVNRYLLQNKTERVLVLYWYQGRGRVAWNEYAVKWDLLRDAALRRRSDEALVRVIVPVTHDEAQAFALAQQVARAVVPALFTALPN